MKKNNILIASLLVVLYLITACTVDKFQLPVIKTFEVINITEVTAVASGSISLNNGSEISTCGVCLSTEHNPTIMDGQLEANFFDTENFYCNIKDLNPLTTYYIRAFATNADGTAYSEEISFTTKVFEITTIPPSFITPTTALSGGMVSFYSDRPDETSRGVCWDTLPSPTIEDSRTLDGMGKGSFKSRLIGLRPNTKYYLRAYISNSISTDYGNELAFTTQSGVISILTDSITSITNKSANFSGTIISDGGGSITEYGFCWNKSGNPIITDNLVKVGSGVGSFTKEVTGLVTNTTYFVRSYAKNEFGTAYGNQQQFKTLPGLPKASFEFDSKGYKVIFTNYSEYATICLWDFGDGSTSTEKSPTHVYTSEGTYNVKLTVSNDGFSDITSKAIIVSELVSLNNLKIEWDYNGTTPIDVDIDGIVDFEFMIHAHQGPTVFSEFTAIFPRNNYEIFTDTTSVLAYSGLQSYTRVFTIPKIYVFGDVILNSNITTNKNISFYCTYHRIDGDRYKYNEWQKDETRYVCFRKVEGDKIKLGWIKLNISKKLLYGFKIPIAVESLYIDN